MSLDGNFIPLETSSTDEWDHGGSNVEDIESVSDAEPNSAVDYWFGKKYLGCIVAESLLCDSAPDDSIEDIDSRLETKLQRYPYHQILRKLQAEGLARPDSDVSRQHSLELQSESYRKALLMLVGTIIRTGGRRERQSLLSSLRAPGDTSWQGHDRGRNGPSATFQGESDPSQEESSPSQELSAQQSDSHPQLPLYSMALKEYGDRVNEEPLRTIKQESLHPPRFKATISFRGREKEGEARNKKDAMHLAAKKMCEHLQIKLS